MNPAYFDNNSKESLKINVKDSVNTEISKTIEFSEICREIDSPYENTGFFTKDRMQYVNGIPGEFKTSIPGYDSGIMLLILGALVIAIFNIKHYSTLIKSFSQDLWNVRDRENAFDNHTLNESRIIISLILILCVCEGIILMCLNDTIISTPTVTLILMSACAFLFYIFQFCSYCIVGYTFTNRNYCRQWLRCFNASQSVLGIFLIIPVLILLFNPNYILSISIICLILYILSRIIFIIKGFRIFYHNLFSLIYFILYLCTLEIVPIVLVYRCRVYLSLI